MFFFDFALTFFFKATALVHMSHACGVHSGRVNVGTQTRLDFCGQDARLHGPSSGRTIWQSERWGSISLCLFRPKCSYTWARPGDVHSGRVPEWGKPPRARNHKFCSDFTFSVTEFRCAFSRFSPDRSRIDHAAIPGNNYTSVDPKYYLWRRHMRT